MRRAKGRYGNKRVRMRGQGGYYADAWDKVKRGAGYVARSVPAGTFSQMGRYLGAAGGASYGGARGAAVGGPLGATAGALLSKLVGFGAYDIKANTLTPIKEGNPVPHFGNLEQATIISHREFIQDITAVGSTTFTNISIPINPGLRGSFPWLSNVSRGYSSYRVLGMVYEFKSTSSDYVTGGAMGSVIMGTDYDVSDPAWTSKLEMENAQYSNSAKPSEDQLHPIECDPRLSSIDVFDVRHVDIPSGKDGRFYDLGNFQIATVGLPTSSGNIGELWVSYEIALFKPILNDTAGALFDHFDLGTSVSTSAYLGTNATASSTSTLGGSTAGSIYSFPAHIASGRYLIRASWIGASTSLTTAMTYGCSGGAVYSYKSGQNRWIQTAGATAVIQFAEYTIEISSSPCTFTFASATLPGTLSACELFVIALDEDVGPD